MKRSVLDQNLSILAKNAQKHLPLFEGAVPMIKANAYGHGLIESAKVFARNQNTVALGVADLNEAIEIRNANIQKPIWIFSGVGGLSDDSISILQKFNINPILSSVEDIQKYSSASKRKRLPNFQIKFNSGMNRLGVSFNDLNKVNQLLKTTKNCNGFCTHFAQALLEESKLTQKQIEEFQIAYALLSSHSFRWVHAANSVASLSSKILKQIDFTNLIRPGIGLYGYAEKRGVVAGLKPALTLKTKVIQTRKLKRDDQVGYDGTFTAKNSLSQSVCSIGYGDGFHRKLSNQKILIGGKNIQILGRISMDMISLNLSAKLGNYVTILGEGHKQMDVLALNAQTISYEILTSITQRVERIYK